MFDKGVLTEIRTPWSEETKTLLFDLLCFLSSKPVIEINDYVPDCQQGYFPLEV